MKIIIKLFLIVLLSLGYTNGWASINLKVGDKAPEFTVISPKGEPIALSSLKGKVVFIDFWASWCIPCREANAELIPVYNKFNEQGFEVFSVSLDTRKDMWIQAIMKDRLPWKYHGSDLKGWKSSLPSAYGVEALPASFLIDEQGVIQGMNLDEYDLEEMLKDLFFEQVNIYPLTASNKLYLTGESKYQIEDISGKVWLKGKATEIDITTLPVGDYVIKLDKRKIPFQKKNFTQQQITFFPQRADDKLTFSAKCNFEIYNHRGKILLKGIEEFADISSFSTGVYYLNLEGTVYTFHKK